MQTELHFRFDTTEDEDFKTITNARRYKEAIIDLRKWVVSGIHGEQPFFDVDTFKEVDRMIAQVLLDHNLDI